MFELIRQNKRRSVVLAIILLIFMLFIGYIIGVFLSYYYYRVTQYSVFSEDGHTTHRIPDSRTAPYYTQDYPYTPQRPHVQQRPHHHPPYSDASLAYEQIQAFVWFYWGPLGAIVAFAVWLIQILYAYYTGGKVLLSLSNAVKIEKSDHPQLYNIVEEMVIASRLPAMPEIYIIDDPAMNAFATGRSPEYSAVAVTRGLLNNMNRDQIQGVIAHEISHIVHRDTLYMTMLAVSVGTIILLVVGLREAIGAMIRGTAGYSRYNRRSQKDAGALIFLLVAIYIFALLLSIIAPLLAQIIYFACSRQREYLADAGAVVFTRNPEGLASALEQIAHSYQRMSTREINQLVAPMFTINPLEINNLDSSSIFSTHPPIQKRIQILRAIAKTPSLMAYQQAMEKIAGKKWKVHPDLTTFSDQPTSTSQAIPSPAMVTSSLTDNQKPAEINRPTLQTKRENARLTSNAIMTAKKYAFLHCACGVLLKIPPNYNGKIICPRCRSTHSVQSKAG